MTPITYIEAGTLLDQKTGTIKHAVGRGVLTRLPRVGLQQTLIKEQVELFKGKRLSLRALNAQEKQVWERYQAMTTLASSQEQSQEVLPTTQQAIQGEQPLTFLDLYSVVLKTPLPENIAVMLRASLPENLKVHL